VWLQDEIEFGTLSSPFNRVDVVVDSIRDRGLDSLPEAEWEAPNFSVKTWGSGTANSQDSFGNLEVSPPVTVDGVEYPHGRIYYGYWRNEVVTQSLQDFLQNQEVQAPFQLDVTWLCVGHVDEFLTFIPDASSEKGFKMLITDTVAGYEFLESLDSSMSIPKYSSHNYSSIADILNDSALRSLNEDIQLDYLNPALAVLETELGITEDDIIRVPMLFEEPSGCGGYTATLFPGTVNMIVATNEDGKGAKLIMPDPYLRSDTSDQSSDPFITHINSLLPEGNEPYWIDDWSEYHMMLGEVHCGSNTLRTPSTTFWNQE
jgi:protein-arginine deiminase